MDSVPQRIIGYATRAQNKRPTEYYASVGPWNPFPRANLNPVTSGHTTSLAQIRIGITT